MSAPTFLRNNYQDFNGENMLPVLEEVFRSELERHESIREKFFRMKKAKNGIYQYSEMHDLPLHAEVAEGEEYSFSRPNQGADKTIAVRKYGLAVSISDEAVRDMKFDSISFLMSKMAESAKETQELQAAFVFNEAFSTTNQTVANGAALCSTSQTLPSGLTWSNRAASDADLSESSLRNALISFETNPIGDTGIKKRIQPRILLVPTALKYTAKEIVGSDLKPDTMDNNINALKGEGLIVVSSPYLTDDDSWFLIAEKERTSLTIVEDMGIETKGVRDDLRDATWYKSRFRERVGVLNGYGIFGVAGA